MSKLENTFPIYPKYPNQHADGLLQEIYQVTGMVREEEGTTRD